MLSTIISLVFLYFPEDKSEYIPALISLAIFSLLAYFATRFFMKISKREEIKAKELEETLKSSLKKENS